MNFEHLGCYFSHSQLYLENLIDFKEAHGGMQMVPLGICEKPEITSFISRQTWTINSSTFFVFQPDCEIHSYTHSDAYAETKNAISMKWIEQITFKRSIEIRNKSQIKIEKIKAVGAWKIIGIVFFESIQQKIYIKSILNTGKASNCNFHLIMMNTMKIIIKETQKSPFWMA